MIINTNVLALNSHRSLKGVGASTAKASARLSSGLKINSAADDAAGLAISEKMKAMIRGSEMAQKNVEDGQSLIKTADGGMGEIQNIVQRQRELVIQALNDTNTDEDRDKIQLELNQLTYEVDAMAERVEFNNKKLLNVPAAGNVKIPLVPTFPQYPHPGNEILLPPAVPPSTPQNPPTPYYIDTAVTVNGDRKGLVNFANSFLVGWRAGDALNFDMSYEFEIFPVKHSNVDPELNAPYPAIPYPAYQSDPAVALFSNGMGFGSENGPSGTVANPVPAYPAPDTQDPNFLSPLSDTRGFRATDLPLRYIYPDITITSPNIPPEPPYTYNWKGSTLGPITENFHTEDDKISSDDPYIDIKFNPAAPDRVTGGGTGGKITIDFGATFKHYGSAVPLTDKFNQGTLPHYDGEWKIDIVNNSTWTEMIPVNYERTVNQPVYEWKYTGANHANSVNGYEWKFIDWQPSRKEVLDLDPDDGEPTPYVHKFEYQECGLGKVTVDLDVDKDIKGEPPLHIQSGANANQSTYIDRYDCRAQALGLTGLWNEPILFTYPKELANEALEKLDEVLTKVSTYRATAGAQQNRLEHTSTSLGVAFTSLSDANSRIADADMAKEMMAISKSNVLQQAATLMLSQANGAPDAVLQLLR